MYLTTELISLQIIVLIIFSLSILTNAVPRVVASGNVVVVRGLMIEVRIHNICIQYDHLIKNYDSAHQSRITGVSRLELEAKPRRIRVWTDIVKQITNCAIGITWHIRE